MKSDDSNTPAPATQEKKPEQSAPAKKKESKVRTSSKARSGGRKKAAAKKARAGNSHAVGRSRFDPEHKVVKTGKANPLRKDSEAWNRLETVIKASGQTVKTVRAKPGLRPTTLSNAVKLGVVKVVA